MSHIAQASTESKMILFAFRKSQKVFFEQMLEHCSKKNFTIVSAKKSMAIALKALRDIDKVSLDKACDFAIKEFYAKTNLPVPKIILLSYFKILSVINFLRYCAVLDKGYTHMLIWNGGKFRQRIALEVARLHNIKVYFFENGLLPNTMVFDKKGINYDNSVPRDKTFFQHYTSEITLPNALVPRVGKNRDIFKGKKEALPDHYIFVPFQVDCDTQIISQSPWIKNMRMLFDVIENIAKESEYHFVIKEHPSSGVQYNDLYTRAKERKNIHFRNSYSTQELIEKSVAVVTINSTVGIESLLFHKEVIVLGHAFYAIEGIVRSVNNKDDLLTTLASIKTLPLDTVLIDNFLKYLYHDYLIVKNDEMYTVFCQKLLKDRL